MWTRLIRDGATVVDLGMRASRACRQAPASRGGPASDAPRDGVARPWAPAIGEAVEGWVQLGRVVARPWSQARQQDRQQGRQRQLHRVATPPPTSSTARYLAGETRPARSATRWSTRPPSSRQAEQAGVLKTPRFRSERSRQQRPSARSRSTARWRHPLVARPDPDRRPSRSSPRKLHGANATVPPAGGSPRASPASRTSAPSGCSRRQTPTRIDTVTVVVQVP